MENLDSGNSVAPDVASGNGDSAVAGSPASQTTSNEQPVTAASLVENYFSQQAPSADSGEAGASTDEAVPQEKTDVVDSAVNPAEEESFGYKTLDDAVRDIRGLRENKKALEKTAKSYESLVGQFENIGLSQDLIEPGLNLLGGLLTADRDEAGNVTRSTAPFFEQLEEVSQPILRQLLADVTTRYPSYVLGEIGRERALTELGLNPALYDTYRAVNPDGSLNGQTVGGYDPDILASIPEPLRDTYKSLPYEDQDELSTMSEERRNYKLQREFEWQQSQRKQKEDAEKAVQAQAQADRHAQEVRLQNFINEQNTAFMNELSASFSPFGNDPAKAPLNQFFHQAIFNEVSRKIESDPVTKGMLEGLGKAARENDVIERQRLLAQINVHVARHRNAMIEELNREVFSSLNGKATAARAANANHTNVTGSGGFSAGNTGNSTPKLGTPEYAEWLLQNSGMRFD